MTTTWETLKEKGNLEFKNKNYQTAIQIYTDAITLCPDQEVLYANRALCYKSLSNYRQALNDINKALNINPKSVKNLKRKYELLVILGNFPEAEQVIQKCCVFEPKEYTHINDLGRAKALTKQFNSFYDAFHTENYSKAEELGKELINACPGNTDFKIAYLDSIVSNNKLTEGHTFYTTKLNENERSQDEAIYIMCKSFYYEGNYEKARGALKKLLNRVNDNQKYNKLYQTINHVEKEKAIANDLFKEGKLDEAIEAYTKLIEIDPKNNNFNSTIYANKALCKFYKYNLTY